MDIASSEDEGAAKWGPDTDRPPLFLQVLALALGPPLQEQ